jgi:phosphate uptake regulator
MSRPKGTLVRAALARATRGLVTGNTALCRAVIAGDGELDRRYLDIERQVVDLLGRHAPSLPTCACSRPSSTSTCT